VRFLPNLSQLLAFWRLCSLCALSAAPTHYFVYEGLLLR
jgi:hypothetical protein